MSAIKEGDRVRLADALPAGFAQYGGHEGEVLKVLDPLSEMGGVESLIAEGTRLGFGEQYVDDAVAIFVRLDSGTTEALTDRQVALVESPVAA